MNSSLSNQLFLKNLLLGLIYFIAGKDLKRKSFKCKNLGELVDLALFYKYSISKHLPPMLYLSSLQIRSELYRFCREILSLKPKIILEIGTANGGTLFLFSKLSKPYSTLISIDFPEFPYIGGIDYKSKIFFKSFASNSQKIKLIRDDSHKFSTLKKVKKVLKNRKVDILFIDGDHTYKGVKKDFKMYGNLVRKNGIIAFHDIVEVTIDDNVEVNKFWNEIKENYNYIELVEDWNQDNCGIGIIINN
jgi:predicted O-methyltransferase YrrM